MKARLAKMIGLPGSVASVTSIGIRVTRTASTNMPPCCPTASICRSANVRSAVSAKFSCKSFIRVERVSCRPTFATDRLESLPPSNCWVSFVPCGQRLLPPVAKGSLPLACEHFPGLCHLEELVALLAALHLLGEAAAVFGVFEIVAGFLQGRCRSSVQSLRHAVRFWRNTLAISNGLCGCCNGRGGRIKLDAERVQ